MKPTLSMSEWIDNILCEQQDVDVYSRETKAQKTFAKPQREADVPTPPRGNQPQKQKPPAPQPQQPAQTDQQPPPAPEQPPADQQQPAQEPAEAPNPEQTSPDVDDVVDKLNQIRAGKSFKDDNINAALRVYFNGLQPDQKENLLQHLRGISQIVSGVGDTPNDQQNQSQQPAPAPEQPPAQEPAAQQPAQPAQPAPTPPIEPSPKEKPKDTRQVKKVKPSIIRNGRSRGIEDYSPPTPISIKKR